MAHSQVDVRFVWIEASLEWVVGGPAAARGSVRSGAAFQMAKLAEQTWPAAAQNVAASFGDITTSPSQDNPCNSKPVLPPGQWTYGQVKT